MTYRQQGEIEQIKAEKDCLKMFRMAVDRGGSCSRARSSTSWTARSKGLIEQAVAEAKSAPPPTRPIS